MQISFLYEIHSLIFSRTHLELFLKSYTAPHLAGSPAANDLEKVLLRLYQIQEPHRKHKEEQDQMRMFLQHNDIHIKRYGADASYMYHILVCGWQRNCGRVRQNSHSIPQAVNTFRIQITTNDATRRVATRRLAHGVKGYEHLLQPFRIKR